MNNIRYCKRCGNPLGEKSRFCDNCGLPVAAPAGTVQPGKGQTSTSGQIRQNQRTNVQPGQRMQSRNQQPGQRVQNSGSGVRTQQPNRNSQVRRNPAYEEEQRRARYREEQMNKEWQQTWDRAGEEEGFTLLQYILIGLMVILLVALIGFGAFLIFGKENRNGVSGQQTAQTGTTTQQQVSNPATEAIEILSGENQHARQTEPVVVQTEKQTEKITEKQTEAVPDMVINYPEFSLTIPGSWKGKYGITQNGDSYTFYHQGSKALGSSGEFFTITCYKDTSYKTKQGIQVLGMGNGTAYVLTVPSDGMYPSGNQTVAEEYKRLNLDFGGISSRFRMVVSGDGPKETEPPQTEPVQIIEIQESPNQQIEVQGVQQSTAPSGGGYIAESSSRLLTDSDVAGMSYDDMQMAVNEIYARHGRRFASSAIQSYFDSQSWYSGTIAPEQFSESVFSATEAQNIQFLLKKMGVQ